MSAREDITLTISATSGPGIPLSMAGYLLQAIGGAYPGTAIVPAKAHAWEPSTLLLRIPADDYLEPQDVDLEALLPTKDDPETLAFISGFGPDAEMRGTPPKWLTALLLSTTRGILEQAQPPNYLEMKLRDEQSGDWFSWIVCKPGAPSPHDLRAVAEARVAELEAELASLAAGVGGLSADGKAKP